MVVVMTGGAQQTSQSLKFPMPDKFSGKKSEDSNDFRDAAKTYVNYKALNDTTENKVQWVYQLLDGTAKAWLKGLMKKDQSYPNTTPEIHD